MSFTKTSNVKIALRILTLIAVVLFIFLQIILRGSPRPAVRFKSDAELARLPIASDSYPCLMVSRTKPSEPLQATIQQCSPALHNDDDIEQYEVDLRSGRFTLRKTDLFVPDSMPLALTRAYRLWDNRSRAFGVGGNHPYDIFPYGDQFPYTYMNLCLGDGTNVHYVRISEGTGYVDFVAEHNGTTPNFFEKSRIAWKGGHWEMNFPDETVFRFPEAYRAKRGVDGALIDMQNAKGEEIKFVRDAKHNLVSITSPHGHEIKFVYDASDRVIEASADNGSITNYSYDPSGRLTEVRQGGLLLWSYAYDPAGMTTVQNADKRNILVNQYAHGRIASINIEKVGTYRLDYLVAPGGKVDETILTEPSGKTQVFNF
jgi:YD repeat-containing protein